MATVKSTNPPRTAKPIPEYRDLVSNIRQSLFEAAYLAQATRAMLHECETTEQDQTLTGVSYLLSMLFERCDELSRRVSDTEFQYVVKEASHG
jgi:hypothetical protein